MANYTFTLPDPAPAAKIDHAPSTRLIVICGHRCSGRRELAKQLATEHEIVHFPEAGLMPDEVVHWITEVVDNEQKKMVIVTTSEILILTIRTLIREQSIKTREVALIVTHNGEAKTIELDRNGALLDAWPNGFFPERERLLRR